VPGDTAPIRDEERFDERAVGEYLRVALPDLIGDHDLHFDQFPGGAANLTYRVVAGDTELVLRRAPLGEVARGGHDMAREYRVLSRLWRAFAPAPRAYHFCEDAAVMGKPFFVMERRHGYVIRAEWPPSWGEDPAIRRHMGAELTTTLAQLHTVDPAAVDLADLGRPDGFVSRQVDGWSRRWESARTRPVPDMEAVAQLLHRHIPPPQTATILHNDYKVDNAMVDERGDIVAVFDWDMATRGDPLVDLGTFLAYWADPDSPTFPIFGERAVAVGPYLSHEEILEIYAAATGLDVSGIRFFEGLALFRIAVIIEQIYARYQAGQTSDLRFAAFEPLAPILGAAAREVIEGLGRR
jgi:aminoglycoside phosphotransferase (APT) family kinase protein